MPVDFEDYRDDSEELGDLPVDPGTNAHAVLGLLAANPDLGFTPAEIQTAVAIPDGSVNPTLARLREQDLVEHASPYWSAANVDRLTVFAEDHEEGDLEGSDDDCDEPDDERGEHLEFLSADHPVRRRREGTPDRE